MAVPLFRAIKRVRDDFKTDKRSDILRSAQKMKGTAEWSSGTQKPGFEFLSRTSDFLQTNSEFSRAELSSDAVMRLTASDVYEAKNLYADPIAIVAVSRGGLGVRTYFQTKAKTSF
jgi:hypothetical protein